MYIYMYIYICIYRGAVVIIDVDDYIPEANRQLNNIENKK